VENNSKLPWDLTKNRQSDSLHKSQLTLSLGVDEGGVADDDDDDDDG
jgi:hypothetical protein